MAPGSEYAQVSAELTSALVGWNESLKTVRA